MVNSMAFYSLFTFNGKVFNVRNVRRNVEKEERLNICFANYLQFTSEEKSVLSMVNGTKSFNGPSRKMSIEHCFSIWPFARFQKMLIKRIFTPLKIRKHNHYKFNIFKRVNGSMDFRNLCKSFERWKLHIIRYYHQCSSSSQMVSFHQISVLCFRYLFAFFCSFYFFHFQTQTRLIESASVQKHRLMQID